MSNQVFLISMLMLAITGFIFGRYQYKHTDGMRHIGMFLLEVAFIIVIVYVLGVWFLDFPIVNAREILLVFMAITVTILGIVSIDDWANGLEKKRKDAQEKEKTKLRSRYERSRSHRVV